jgi:NAD(P)-dependent dehydrogenase (short-subunit alcohol dehydrogenase family)
MTNPREQELIGQTVVLIGGSAGIGLETARRARAAGAEVILTGRRRRWTSAPSAPLRSTPTTRHRWRSSSAACQARSIMC